MTGTRASDADRDAHVEIIEAAYVDGRLNDIEREIRVGGALRATTLEELHRLVRDLAPPPPRRPVATPAPGSSTTGSRGLALAVLVAAGLVVVGAFVAVISLASGHSESPPVGVEAPVSALEPDDTDRLQLHTPEGFEAFVAAVDEHTGTTMVERAVLHPNHASVTVIVPGHPNRTETHSYHEGFSANPTKSTRNSTFPAEIDLVDINLDVMLQQVHTAPRDYSIDEVTSVYVVIDSRDRQPAFSVYVSNEYSESAYRSFTLDGTELHRYPQDVSGS